MNNNDIVSDMLKSKFASREVIEPQNVNESYDTNAIPKEVNNSIYSKLGFNRGAEKEPRVKELIKNRIKDVMKNIDETDKSMKALSEEFLIRGKALDEVRNDLKTVYETKLEGKGFSVQEQLLVILKNNLYVIK
ncbi:hypothetical protein [Clostridium estertheticum]|uniref:hypothetical protein n=1 Tax=Clostridium estertheticum TaxID=238834 RepID=UPI001C7D7AF2|nr:hypothetical protein [Clostridium estertheticum]MBX4268900.1 hypothetical protein [Clostridium estertheticum]WLC78907.1 hypothetical protein KTC98_17180 [Clostridium estertheticum]